MKNFKALIAQEEIWPKNTNNRINFSKSWYGNYENG